MSITVKNGLAGGVMGFLMSFLLNYFLIPFPESVAMNAVGNGISGLVSVFMGGYIGLSLHIRKTTTR